MGRNRGRSRRNKKKHPQASRPSGSTKKSKRHNKGGAADDAPGFPRVHRLSALLVFQSGIAPGAGKEAGNLLGLARMGQSRSFVLRGTTIAGVLRNAYARRLRATGVENPEAELRRWFGHALGAEADGTELSRHHGRPSPLRVADAVLDLGDVEPQTRTFNAIDRHTGAVREGGLFSIEVLPPGTMATVVLHLHVEEDQQAETFIAWLAEALGAGLLFGGHGARGIGLASLFGAVEHRMFDLSTLDGHAAWLDESWKWREGSEELRGGKPLRISVPSQTLVAEFRLEIPRGQDICVSDGIGVDVPIEPQRVTNKSGKEHWRIPGSTLRGLFRGWVTRLAARSAWQGHPEHAPADNVERFTKCGAATGDDVGWGFVEPRDREASIHAISEDPSALAEHVTCPVMRLFGSLLSAGRVHISDALSTNPIADHDTQLRKHVAIDRLTGGANEGFLFEHAALLAGVTFEVKLTIREPSEVEVRWISQTLVALHLGLLRVGSSKSSGRLVLAAPPAARGPHSGILSSVASNIG